LFDELARDYPTLAPDLDRRLERYVERLNPPLLRATGGDRFPLPPLRATGGVR